MTGNKKCLILYLILAFTTPLLMVLAQSKISDSTICFILYGIQAAAPSISAIVVFALNKELKTTISRSFRKDHLISSVLLPIVIVCAVMIPAKLIYSLFFSESGSFWGTVSQKQCIIILWAILAEELGWRGYLEPELNRLGINRRLVPGIVGLIWCAWHYHYFLQNGNEIPLYFFLPSCIIESYIYSALMRFTKANIVSVMFLHFIYNLMIHVVAINPSDNNGSIVPYMLMIIMEFAILVLMLLIEKLSFRRFLP